MSQHCHFDASRSLTALEQDSTIIAVIEMSQSKWLVAALVPGVERQPLKKLDAQEEGLLKLLHRWRAEAGQAGRTIKRIVVAYEAGRDGFWLARWLRARDVEAYVIHPTSIAVSREHRRAKTDRLDTELLIRAFLGWLRGEMRHCSMVAIPTIEEEDARRPNRERQNLVTEQTRLVNQMKAIFTRFGIRSFRPTLRKAEDKLKGLRTAEGTPLPENTRAEVCRHLARLRVVREQIRAGMAKTVPGAAPMRSVHGRAAPPTCQPRSSRQTRWSSGMPSVATNGCRSRISAGLSISNSMPCARACDTTCRNSSTRSRVCARRTLPVTW